MAELFDVCPVDELPPGAIRVVQTPEVELMVVNCAGELLAMEDRCSHDDGPLGEGEIDERACTVECPRHGSVFDLRTGIPKTLPAYEPVPVFAVEIIDGDVYIDPATRLAV